MSPKLNESSKGDGKSGFAIFSPRLLSSQGWSFLSSEKGGLNQSSTNLSNRISEIVGLYSDEDDANAEWAHGSFPLEEYIKALDRAKGELYYNHSLGMQFSKVRKTACVLPFFFLYMVCTSIRVRPYALSRSGIEITSSISIDNDVVYFLWCLLTDY